MRFALALMLLPTIPLVLTGASAPAQTPQASKTGV